MSGRYRDWKRGVHVRTCRCIPTVTCGTSCVPPHPTSCAIGLQPPYKFRHNPSGRYRDMETGFARAHVQMHPTSDWCKPPVYWVSGSLATRDVKFFPKSGPDTEPSPHNFWTGPASSPAFISGPSIGPAVYPFGIRPLMLSPARAQ